MCSRTQYKHNVHVAAQCAEVSGLRAFLLPRALTDVLFLLFVPSALRGIQHTFDLHVSFCKKAGTCPKNWDGLGSRGVVSPVPIISLRLQLHSCTALLLSLSLILQQLQLGSRFWVLKMVPKILQANLIFYVVLRHWQARRCLQRS